MPVRAAGDDANVLMAMLLCYLTSSCVLGVHAGATNDATHFRDSFFFA